MKEINHMDLVTRGDLEALLQMGEGPCVSLFMPAHRAGPEMRQDPIRLKNLLGEAEQRLGEAGLRAPEARALLEPARKLLDDQQFWRHQSDGLALFVCPARFHPYRLPLELDDLVVVGERFHIKPLVSLLSGDGRFYLLALSQGEVRLLQGTRYTVGQVELDGVPESLAEVLRQEGLERQLQFHSHGGPRGAGERSAIFHGHGEAEEDAKDDILRFFRQLDRGLGELLQGEQVPMVLAGVDYLLPLYREASTYPHLVEGGIKRNPQDLSPKQLHEESWRLVEPVFRAAQQEAEASFQRLVGTGRASADLEQVVPAAHHGRVASLFIGVGVQRWGAFDPATNRVELRDGQQAGEQDLLDLAAACTLLAGGSVYAVQPEEVPGQGAVAAVFRY